MIGAGSMGSRHARIFAELPETKLVAVVGATERNCVRVAVQYGGRPYTDYLKMLTVEHPDLVTVAVPTILHMKVSKTALDAGCHVLVEKPIAASIEEAQNLIKAARTANRKLMVGHVVRFDPTVQALKHHIVSGQLGRMYQIVCRRIGPFPHQIRDVGVVLDLAPHDLDVMCYILGEKPQCVFAQIAQHIHADHEDLLSALLRFPNGIVGMLEINWLTPNRVRDIAVLGERGMLHADCIAQTLILFENSEVDIIPQQDIKSISEGRMIQYPIQHQDPLQSEISAFIAAVLNDTNVPVSGTDGLNALRLSLALLKSGEEHSLVQV